jgi:hypothetical protein
MILSDELENSRKEMTIACFIILSELLPVGIVGYYEQLG